MRSACRSLLSGSRVQRTGLEGGLPARGRKSLPFRPAYLPVEADLRLWSGPIRGCDWAFKFSWSLTGLDIP